MRLIDADALIILIQEEKIEGKILDIIKTLGDGLQAETLNQACDRHIKMINSLDTIDAVPVVRCKDCRHRDPEDHKCDCGENERQGCPFKVADDYFCAYGERKSEC